MDGKINEYGYPFEKPQKNFDKADAIVAIILFVIGYFIANWNLFLNGPHGLGTLTLIVAMAIISCVYMHVKGIKLTKKASAQLVLIVILSLPLLLSSDPFIKFLVSSYSNISFVYWFFCACGNREENKIGDMLFFDLVKSTLLLPFSCFTDIFHAIGRSVKSTSFGKKAGLAIIGIIIAIVPTMIVTGLLISADEAFFNLFDKLYDNIFADLGEKIFYFILGIPVAMYIFGFLFSNVTHEKKDLMTREQNEKSASVIRFLPSVVTCAAITPIILVYILFFFSQTSYFLSAFSGIRPEDVTYAEYARKGFFELCGVSIINAIIIICSSVFTKRSEKRAPLCVRIYTVILSAFTLALIAIALSKMLMYIDAYGLSILRIYPTWFMILLALIFIFIIIKQICFKFNLARTLAIAFTIMFAVLIFSDTDAIVARYNIDAYKTGKLDTVDVWMLHDMSDSVVEYVIPLVNDEKQHIREAAESLISKRKKHFENTEDSFADFNLSTWRAKKAIDAYYKETK